MTKDEAIDLAIKSIEVTHSEIWTVDYESDNPKIVEIRRGDAKEAIAILENLRDEKGVK